ncbi:MAG: sulfinoalanine decarboxylase, partial [Ulvibacter sp.]
MEKDLALFNKLATLLLKKENEEPIAQIIPPNEMHESLDISLEDSPASEAFFEEALEKLVLSTPRTASRQFFNQLFGGRISKATLGDLLAVLLNNSMYTYKVAGPQVGVE